jgi:hypothetical protein
MLKMWNKANPSPKICKDYVCISIPALNYAWSSGITHVCFELCVVFSNHVCVSKFALNYAWSSGITFMFQNLLWIMRGLQESRMCFKTCPQLCDVFRSHVSVSKTFRKLHVSCIRFKICLELCEVFRNHICVSKHVFSYAMYLGVTQVFQKLVNYTRSSGITYVFQNLSWSMLGLQERIPRIKYNRAVHRSIHYLYIRVCMFVSKEGDAK